MSEGMSEGMNMGEWGWGVTGSPVHLCTIQRETDRQANKQNTQTERRQER